MVPKIPMTIRTLTCLGLGPTSRLRPLSTSTLPFWAIPTKSSCFYDGRTPLEMLEAMSACSTSMARCNSCGGTVRSADFIEIPNATGRKSAGRALVTGDVIKATISGNTIVAYLNGVELSQVTDSTWPTGQPGIGFFKRTHGREWGFRHHKLHGLVVLRLARSSRFAAVLQKQELGCSKTDRLPC